MARRMSPGPHDEPLDAHRPRQRYERLPSPRPSTVLHEAVFRTPGRHSSGQSRFGSAFQRCKRVDDGAFRDALLPHTGRHLTTHGVVATLGNAVPSSGTRAEPDIPTTSLMCLPSRAYAPEHALLLLRPREIRNMNHRTSAGLYAVIAAACTAALLACGADAEDDPTANMTGTESQPVITHLSDGGVTWSCPEKKTLLCHAPPGNPANAHTLCVGRGAVRAHLSNHPDVEGACEDRHHERDGGVAE